MKAGEVGEIVFRGPQVMTGYWNDPEKTAETMRSGWMHSGDMATLDERGYLTIVDRKKDLIISGGANISSREVEEVFVLAPRRARGRRHRQARRGVGRVAARFRVAALRQDR